MRPSPAKAEEPRGSLRDRRDVIDQRPEGPGAPHEGERRSCARRRWRCKPPRLPRCQGEGCRLERPTETLTRSCPNRRGLPDPCVDFGGLRASLSIRGATENMSGDARLPVG